MENKLVYVDDRQYFITNNPTIPEDAMFHTFLLDRENRIVLVGNPVHNEKLWELYKNTINQLIKDGGLLKNEQESDPLGVFILFDVLSRFSAGVDFSWVANSAQKSFDTK